MEPEDSEVLEKAAEIVKNSKVGSFPDDYIQMGEAEEIEIPTGTVIIMFRQDENVVVSIDGSRMYLRTYDDAKYIFYSAKRGKKYVKNPSGFNLQEAIKKFEDDLDSTNRQIEVLSTGMNQEMKDKLRVECSRLLGYFDIF